MKRIVSLAIASGLIASCSPKNNGSGIQVSDYNAIFSTRPQAATHAMFMIKLRAAPLLTDAKIENGKAVIDPARAEAVAKEQEELMKQLAALSGEIKPLYKYRMVLNAVTVVAPLTLEGRLKSLTNVAYIEHSGSFSRPVEVKADDAKAQIASMIKERNSVKFIGGDVAHARGLRGQGMRVGVIDTGIDYTHAMFGGAGTEEAFKAVDPSKADSAFPTAKIVGGYDFVGTKYNSGSADFMNKIPKPDENPMDEGGHGTHVAGTVAGVGDLENTYDGVAPDASLYALKVFGADGSTGDAVVIASLEYSADPNNDGNPNDRLDVVNLSLGGGYGEPHLLYTEAIQNLSRGGCVVVASAGNSGDESYIVGAPSVADAAISVAASVDDMDQNWKFRAIRFSSADMPEIVTEAIEGTIGKPIAEIGEVSGELVFAGLADKDFSEELKAAIKGKVAFIDRGVVPFSEKIRRATEAGAIGVVMGNNQPGDPIPMGGDGKYDVPAIMITKALADQIKAAMAKAPVVVDFKTPQRIEKPELIDTITNFSSKGPRSLDALVKPEIAAPGAQVISAKMGGGKAGEPMSGTSMAAPHMAGVMALLRQARPELEVSDLKSIAMNTAKTLVDPTKKTYPVSRQGAGRIQIIRALEAPVATVPQALSLGEVTVESRKVIAKTLEIRNLSKEAVNFAVRFDGHPSIRVVGPANVALAAGEKTTLSLRVTVDATSVTEGSTELDGLLKLMNGETEVARVPVLAVANKVSRLKADKLVIQSTSEADAQGAVAELTVSNKGSNPGVAYPFNSIGKDARKIDPTSDPFRSRACDLSDAGYRVIVKDGKPTLQVAVKLFEPVTTWDSCEVSVLIDGNGDGVFDQELVGTKQDRLKGLTKKEFASLLIDANAARSIRRQFELDSRAHKPGDKNEPKEDYTPALQALGPMMAFPHSTVAILEVPVAALKAKSTGELAVRIAASYQESTAIEPDDFLEKSARSWTRLSLAAEGAGFAGLPEKIELAPGTTQTVSFAKGAGLEKLLVLYPSNKPVVGGLSRDEQAEIVTPIFEIKAPKVAGR